MRKWCFLKVTMADRASADRACKDPNPIIDGRKANVNLAYLGAKPRVIQPGECLCLCRELEKHPWGKKGDRALPPSLPPQGLPLACLRSTRPSSRDLTGTLTCGRLSHQHSLPMSLVPYRCKTCHSAILPPPVQILNETM